MDLSIETCRIAGTVKFTQLVTIEQLRSIITGLREQSPDRWIDLHIRKAGDDGTHYLAFHCIVDNGSKRTYKKTVDQLLGCLRWYLGTKLKSPVRQGKIPFGVIGWNISIVEATA